MASYHVLTGRPDGNAYSVVFHIPIPSVNNRVGVNYRTALVNSGLGGTTSLVEGNAAGQITTAEKASIASGALYEYVEEFATNPGETAAQIQARIDARYTALVTQIQADFSGRLAYFGHTRTVA
jgi:hypothetical protein